jgi:hypothetical protein
LSYSFGFYSYLGGENYVIYHGGLVKIYDGLRNVLHHEMIDYDGLRNVYPENSYDYDG